MGLGPPVCKRHMKVMGLDSKRYPPWKCDEPGCEVDQLHTDCEHLFDFPPSHPIHEQNRVDAPREVTP